MSFTVRVALLRILAAVDQVPVERLNWLLQSVVLGFSPEPMTAAERAAYVKIKAEVAANPDVEWCPLPD
jgi:hypothetical protein